MKDVRVIQAAMDRAVLDGVFPGGVLAARSDGERKLLIVAGHLSSEPGSEAVEASTIYDLASLTKPLATVTSVVLLTQAGKLALDAAIWSIVVELEGTPLGSVTVRDLLAHRSGLPGWRPVYERLDVDGVAWGQADPSIVRQALLRFLREEPLLFGVGQQSLYSDLGFMLIGVAVERASGLLLDEFFHRAVAQPLGACPLLFHRTGALSRSESRQCVGSIAPTEWDNWRKRLLKGEVHDENAAAMGGVAGHAGLFGTAEAVLAISGAWLAAYLGARSMLDQRLVREFTRRHPGSQESSWALGWDTPSPPSSSGTRFSTQSFGHLGFTGTSVWIDPHRRLEVVLLTNRVHPSRKNDSIRAFRPMIHDLVSRELVSE
jgi:CubicO group peptidase (beta-lactamase class C family)